MKRSTISTSGRVIVWSGAVGFGRRPDQTRPTAVLFFDPQDRNIYQGDAFAQDEIALRPDRLFLTVGSRFEQTTFSGFEVQPSVRVRYSATSTATLWGAISRATRTPTRFDQDLRIQIGPVVAIRGDRDFRSEQLVAYEAGVRIRPSVQVSLDAAGFFHDYDDLRSQEPTAPAGFAIVLRNLYQGHLTVGESADFIEMGGIINLVTVAGRVRFEIAVGAAERRGLRISSRLLRLAVAIHES